MSDFTVPVLDSSDPRTRDNIVPFQIPKKPSSDTEFDFYSILSMTCAAVAVFTKIRLYAFASFLLCIATLVIKGFGTGQAGSAGLMMSMTAMTQIYMPLLIDTEHIKRLSAERAAASATATFT